MIARDLTDDDTTLYKLTSFETYDKFPNGTTIVTYRNGTIAAFNDSSFLYYIKAPQSYFYSYEDGSYRYVFLNDSRILHFEKELTAESTLSEIALSIDFWIQFANGTRNVTYNNGTIALFQVNLTSGEPKFVSYVVAPTSFFVDYTDVTLESGIKRRTFENQTVRDIYPEPTSTSTRA